MDMKKRKSGFSDFLFLLWERVLEMQRGQRVQGHACGVKVQRVQKVQRFQRVVVSPPLAAMSFIYHLRRQRCQRQRKP